MPGPILPRRNQRVFPSLLNSLAQPLRILVNNAGIGKMGHLEQLSAADIEKVLATNLLGHILVTKHCLPVMKQHHAYSDLIFISSESARQGGKEGSVYCAGKFGLRGFAQSLRPECAKAGVRVNLINPGAVRSAFDELHFEPGPEAEHAILPADVAAIVLAVVNSPGYGVTKLTCRRSPRSGSQVTEGRVRPGSGCD